MDRAMIARYGLTVEEVADTVATALGGRESGLLYEGDRRYEIAVRVPEETRMNLDDIRALPVLLPEEPGEIRQQIPLSRVRSEEHTSELQSLMRISYAVFCLKKKKKYTPHMRVDTVTYQTLNPNKSTY